MTVTKITEVSKSRVQVTIDDEFAFVLYKGELRMYHLQEGEAISEEAYREIKETVLPKRAKLRAMNLLKSRAYTEKQLWDKLNAGGYPKEVTEAAIAYVRSFGYVDDRQYARDFIEYRKDNQSRKQIFQALIQKGISKQTIEEVWEELSDGDERKREYEQILVWIKKKNFNAAEATYEEKQKFCAFLYRKGFQIDNIRSALSLDITSI